MPVDVRLAADHDVPPASETLALAHHDYAWARWAFPRPDRLNVLRRLFELDLRVGIVNGTAWVTDDSTSVAIWSPPAGGAADDATDGSLADAAHAQQDTLIGDDVVRLQAADALTRAHHPSQPYWYLGTVGTRPDRRGSGHGTAVIRPVLDRCDSEHIAACLETSSDSNVRWYESLGFVSAFRTTTADGTLPLIVMQRQPGSGRAA